MWVYVVSNPPGMLFFGVYFYYFAIFTIIIFWLYRLIQSMLLHIRSMFLPRSERKRDRKREVPYFFIYT